MNSPTRTDDSSYYRQSRNDEDYSYNSRYNNYSHADDIMSHIDDTISAKSNPKLMIYEETDSPLIYASHKTNSNLSDYWR